MTKRKAPLQEIVDIDDEDEGCKEDVKVITREAFVKRPMRLDIRSRRKT